MRLLDKTDIKSITKQLQDEGVRADYNEADGRIEVDFEGSKSFYDANSINDRISLSCILGGPVGDLS